MVLAIVTLFCIGRYKARGGAQHRIHPAQIIGVLGVKVLPPQALDRPWSLADLVAPGRDRIRHHLTGRRIGGVREVGARQIEFLLCALLRHAHQILAEFDVRQVLLDVIAGKHTPEDLLRVVIHVVVAVPGRADLACRPVPEKARRYLALAQAAGKIVLVVVPDSLQLLVFQLHCRTRPELLPVRRRVAADAVETSRGKAFNFLASVGDCVEVLPAIGMILRDHDPEFVIAGSRCLALQPFQQSIARRRQLNVQAENLLALSSK